MLTLDTLVKFAFIPLLSRVKSRTQESRPRPRTQKNPRPRPKTAFPKTDPLEAKDRNARGQGQGPRTRAQGFSKNNFFFRRPQKKKRSKKFLLVIRFGPEAWLRKQQILLQTGLQNISYSLAARKPKLYSSLTNGIQIWVSCQ